MSQRPHLLDPPAKARQGVAEAGDSKGRCMATTCQGCLTNCSVCAQVEGERVVRVVGNDASSATRGALCGNVRMAIQQREDSDRVLYPMRRTNSAKGRDEDPGWRRITWDEALDELADRLIALRQEGQTHRFAVMSGRSTVLGELFSRALPRIYGTPNHVSHESICNQCEKNATGCLDGVWDYHGIDYETCAYLVLWGMDPLASNRWKSSFRSSAARLKERAHVVVIDPRRSETAGYAHEWLPVIPGTDGALACALAHVIVKERLYDKRFVEAHTSGLADWWSSVLYETTPEWAQERCGVDAETIRRIARGLAAAGPHGVSLTSSGVAMAKRGLYSCMAAYALNGLTGAAGAGGSLVSYAPLALGKLPDVAPFQDAVALAGCAQPQIDHRHDVGFMSMVKGVVGAGHNGNFVPEALAAGDPYTLDTVISCWCNFAFSSPGCERWCEALARIPFLVDVTTHVSETARFADIVLPARHHMFETWGLVASRQNGHTCLSLQQPCVDALGEARNDEAGVPFMLAQKLRDRGFPNLYDYYRAIVDPLTGAAPETGDELAEYATKRLSSPYWERKGWEVFCAAGVGEIRDEAEAAASDAMRFATPSGTFEFCSGHLKRMLAEYGRLHDLPPEETLQSLDYEASVDVAAFPHYESPLRVGDADEFPFVFSQHRSHASLEGRSANTPLFQELKGLDPGDEPWDDVVKIHPDDMAKLGLEDGMLVRMSSPSGSIVTRAKAWNGTRPGVVVKCYGQGHWAYGRIASSVGANNNELVPAQWERITSSAVRHGGITRMRIERVR